jgi:L-malate glycosyltransferase
VSDPERRFRLGRFGRDFVVRRFSLERATRLQVKIYEEVLRVSRQQAPMEPLRMISRALAQEVRSHNPLVKHGQAQLERRLLTAAAGGTWPPAPPHHAPAATAVSERAPLCASRRHTAPDMPKTTHG